MTQLEKQAQMMQSQASVFFRNQMGLGMENQAFNPWNMSGGGITSFVLNQMGGMLASGQIPKDKDNKFPAMDKVKFQEMLQDYYTSGLGQYKDADGNPQEGKYGSNGQFTQDEVTAFKMAMQAAQQNQSQANMMCQQMSQNYQNNVSIWLEAAKEQLEAEQDAALAPLEMEQTDMELEKESVETQLAYAKERLQSIEQACSEETKNAAPKFGLG
ncbi:TPA: hypothetical protein CPT99_00365 [Candidatus Gastranaerophilales bacterium HUM_4]|nr:MAG TPA: hypothetical protein CPT99_00365 [Candidatus Gastranaerophilales bacterium HUM_4]